MFENALRMFAATPSTLPTILVPMSSKPSLVVSTMSLATLPPHKYPHKSLNAFLIPSNGAVTNPSIFSPMSLNPPMIALVVSATSSFTLPSPSKKLLMPVSTNSNAAATSSNPFTSPVKATSTIGMMMSNT